MLSVNEQDIDRITEAIHHLLKGRIPEVIKLPTDYPDNEICQLVAYVNALSMNMAPWQARQRLLSKAIWISTCPKGKCTSCTH